VKEKVSHKQSDNPTLNV